jgi:hypothetical protein
MSQFNGELERAFQVVQASVGQTLVAAGDSVRYVDDEDNVVDSWLASLSIDEFDRFLSRLAESYVGGVAVLDPPA